MNGDGAAVLGFSRGNYIRYWQHGHVIDRTSRTALLVLEI